MGIRTIMGATTALVLGTVSAQAGGIDRSGQSIGALFEKGSYAEFSFGSVTPEVSGTDVATAPTGDVAGDFTQFGFAYKRDAGDRLSYAIIVDQPFGADILYGATSPVLGGTRAVVDSVATTVLLRYKLDENWSVHGGLRADYASGAIDLRGLGYGPLNGYSVTFDNDLALGYAVGASYEIPDIALRIALTYNSVLSHDFETREILAPGVVSTTSVDTPQSVNLDFQTGIAKDTLLFGQIRWVDWSEFTVTPAAFGLATGGASLVALEDTTTYTLGVGRRFNEAWSGAFSVSYEAETNPAVSPLAPTNGRIGATLAAIYTMDNTKITAGINYIRLGDATAAPGGVPAASMTGSTALGVGIKVGYSF